MAYLHNNKDQFQDAIELAYEQTGIMAQAIEKDLPSYVFLSFISSFILIFAVFYCNKEC